MGKINGCQQGEGEPIAQPYSYIIFGHFRGDKMEASTMPYILGGKAKNELSELMSNETLDEMNDFKNQYFGGLAELEDLWKGKPVFL